MPRESSIRIKGQTPVNPKELYDPSVPSRDINARPVSQDVRAPSRMKANAWAEFGGAMGNLMGMGAKVAGDYQDNQGKAGMTARMKGEARDETQGERWLREYDKYGAKASVLDFRTEMDALHGQSGNLSLDEWNKAKDGITKKYLTGASDDYIRGFVPGAAEVEAHFDAKYQADQQVHIDNDFLTKTNKIVELQLRTTFGKDAPGADQGVNRGAQMRKYLTTLQSEAIGLGAPNKSKITRQFMHVIGNAAIIEGRPDYLTFLTEPDAAGGITIANMPEFNQEAMALMVRAENARQANEVQAEQERTARSKELVAEAHRNIINAAHEGDMGKARAWLYASKNDLTPAALESAWKTVEDLQDGAGFARSSDPSLYENLRISALERKLSVDQLRKYRGSLSNKDYRKVFEEMVTYSENDLSDARSQGRKKSEAAEMVDAQRTIGKQMCGQKGELDKYLSPLEATQRQGLFDLKYRDWIAALAETHGGENKIPNERIHWAQQKAAYQAYQAIPAMGQERNPLDPDAPKGSQVAAPVAQAGAAGDDPNKDDFFTQ